MSKLIRNYMPMDNNGIKIIKSMYEKRQVGEMHVKVNDNYIYIRLKRFRSK